jgi:tRNA pseudouridine38-40 synthase
MRNIKLTVAYDGTGFHGWQIQPGVATIQGSLAEAASEMTQEKIFVHGASRTDAGVHALGQTANFKTHSALSAEDFRRGLNALLPPQIRVMAAEEVGPDFHSRWQALGKTYRYRIFRGLIHPPWEVRRSLHYPWTLDEEAMAEAAQKFEGRHDFTSFAASTGDEQEDSERDAVKEIWSSRIVSTPYLVAGANGLEEARPAREMAGGAGASGFAAFGGAEGEPRYEDVAPHYLDYFIHGNSFLRYMVRKIVGTLLEVGKHRMKVEEIDEIFEARDRSRSGVTVAPDGLCLISLEYPDPTASLKQRRRPERKVTDSKAG